MAIQRLLGFGPVDTLQGMLAEQRFSYEIQVVDLDALLARNAEATLGSRLDPRFLAKACMRALLWSLLVYVFAFQSNHALISAWIGIAIGGLWLTFMPAQIRKFAVARMHNRLSDPSSRFLLGQRTLEIDPDRFAIIGPDSELRIKWTSLQRVVETPERLFLYVTGFTAHVVPLYQPDRSALVTALRRHAGNAFADKA